MSDVVERAKAAMAGIGESLWHIAVNRHPNCDGSAWGWIAGAVNHWTWSEEKRLSRRQAEFVVAARTLVPELIAEVERLHSWDGLMSLLDEHYPADIFPTLDDDENRDKGPRVISLIRRINEIRGNA